MYGKTTIKNVKQCYPNVLPADPFWFRNITTDPHILVHVNIECPNDRSSKFEIYVSVKQSLYRPGHGLRFSGC
jgi:hypothetical protein